MNSEAPAARIAVCEDERIVALDIQNFLRRNGYHIVGIYAEAEILLEQVDAIAPDLVLMDIHLQGRMDGVEASVELMSRWAIPVIFLTAYDDAITIERAKMGQPYGYVTKPFDERDLKIAIIIGLYRSSMERRIRRSEARYRGLFEDGLAAMFISDAAGSILEANTAFRQLAGNTAHLDQLVIDPENRRSIDIDLVGGGRQTPSEVSLRRADDSQARVLLSSTAIRGEAGGRNYLFQALDITESRNLQDQLARAQKMEALARLASGAAHDFNNIITAILGYAKLLREDLDLEGRPNEDLDGIEAAARRAAGLARQLLMFSRNDTSAPSVFSLGALVSDMDRMLERLVGDEVTVRSRSMEGDNVRAERPRIEQVVLNLVVNARDAMPKGGTVTLTTGRLILDQPLPGIQGSVPAGTWAFLRVADEGDGISPEILPHIFKPFFSTKPAESGTGLGLATVVSVVRQAEGHMELSSTQGRGTTFTVYLPAVDEEGTTEAEEPAERMTPGFGETVLLVEDDDSVRALLETMLERAGYVVLSAGNPGSALLLAERDSRKPDVLVSDVVMPLMRGPELAARLRTRQPGLPVLFLSGRPENEVRASCGDDDFLCKPFSEEEFLSALKSVLAASRK